MRLERPRTIWEDNIKIDRKETLFKCICWTVLKLLWITAGLVQVTFVVPLNSINCFVRTPFFGQSLTQIRNIAPDVDLFLNDVCTELRL